VVVGRLFDAPDRVGPQVLELQAVRGGVVWLVVRGRFGAHGLHHGTRGRHESVTTVSAHKPMPTVALSFSSHSSAMRRYLASSGESVFHILLTNLYGITRLEEGSPPGSAQRPRASAASDHTRRAPIARHGDLCCGQHPALCPQKPPRLRLRREPTAGSPSPTAAPGLRGRRASTRSGIRLLQSLGLERLPRGVLKSGPLRA